MKLNSNFAWLAMLFLTASILAMLGCNKNNAQPQPEEPAVTTGASTRVFYVDTFKVYSTNLSGGDRKELINEDLKSQNNYIASYSIAPGSGKIVYQYRTGYQDPITIKIANADGSDKKVLKTFAAGTEVYFAKAIAGNRIYYGTGTTSGTTTLRKFYVMNDDGTGEKELTGINSFANIRNDQVSSEGKGLITGTGYFVKLNNDAFAEADSYNVLTNENQTNIFSGVIMSSDAKKIAFISRTATADKYEIRVKDISTRNTTSTIALTYTVPASGPGAIANPGFGLCWVDGNQRLLLSYGKFTFPKGAPSDYVFCQLLDPSKTDITTWSFTGDGSLTIQAN